MFVAGALEGDGENVAVGSGAINTVAILPDHGVKRFVTGFDAHSGLNEVVVNRLGTRPAEVRTQARDGGNLSAHNPAKKTNGILEIKMCTGVCKNAKICMCTWIHRVRFVPM
jgi:hypothetical protein